MSSCAASLDPMANTAGLFSGQTPLPVRMRPTSLDEVAGQQHLLRPGAPLVVLADHVEVGLPLQRSLSAQYGAARQRDFHRRQRPGPSDALALSLGDWRQWVIARH